jgi:Hemerythrin HHE cation binding domain
MSDTLAGHGRTASDAVLCMLRNAHDRLLDEFNEFERLDAHNASQDCQRVAQRTFAELKVIAAVERQLLYPALSQTLAGTDLIEQSEIEHTCIGRLIDSLEIVAPSCIEYRKGFRILGEHVRRHIDDEEHELFPVLRAARIDWYRLHQAMQLRRAELAEDLGIADIEARRRPVHSKTDLEVDDEFGHREPALTEA